ncbi:MAG: rRNA (uracil1939-C5)-methyltransferase, partial [Clostridiales bacterium]|nr:rRNA (uracil1939-C5)-methyltransferase [Clostridiales bacterium]
MRKGDSVTLTIEKNKYPNMGIGYHEGQKIFVKQAIKGQKVTVRISKKRAERIEGRIMEIIEKSPMEQASFCEHFGACGGCALQTLSAEGQLAMKREMVFNLFEEAKMPIEILDVIESPTVFEYRNKMEFSFGDEVIGGPLTLGMHKKGRYHDVVDVPSCHLVDADYRLLLTEILAYFKASGLPRYDKKQEKGFLRHLVIRKSVTTAEILVALSATTQVPFDGNAFVEMLRALPLSGELTGVLYVRNDGKSDMVSGAYDVLFGRDYIMEHLMGLSFKVTLYSFFQTNTRGAEYLYKTALDLIPDLSDKVCFDLFSGTGTIGQIMAKRARKVIGIEIVPDAVDAANENAKLNGLDNCTFLCGDVYQTLDTVEARPDVIVVDPPRAGIGEKAVQRITAYGVPEIVYISCNPKTLYEDLAWFKRAGYAPADGLKLVDMFPWTYHVETVVLLSHKKADTHINVNVEFGEGEGKIPVGKI